MKTKTTLPISHQRKSQRSITQIVTRLRRPHALVASLAWVLLVPMSLSAIAAGMGNVGRGRDNANASEVTRSNQPQTLTQAFSVHVASVETKLSGVWSSGIGRNLSRYNSQATVIIVDDLDQPVSGARVTGTFTGNYLDKSQTVSGTTGSDGSVTLKLQKSVTQDMNGPSVNFTFCVDEVEASLPYNPAANVITCDDAR